MKRILTLFAFMLAMGLAAVQAQIPAEVSNVMNKCRAAMSNPAGLEYEMDMKAGMGPVSMKMHIVSACKGKLRRASVTTKLLGVEVVSMTGFDGTDTWEVKQGTNCDTVIIERGDKKDKGSEALELDYDKQFTKAKMHHKVGYYEITFSEPKDKSSEVKSATVKVSDKNYALREVRSGARGAKITMTITRIHVGLNDSHFKLDLSKHPGSVVVRK